MTLMTIGEFAERTHLSPKALRLYDQLGLVAPARVDASSGYRFDAPEQVEVAPLVGLLRQLDMPLATIASVLEMNPSAAADALSVYWEHVEATMADRRALVAHIQARLTGEEPAMYDVSLRHMPERKLVTTSRHLHVDAVDACFDEAYARLRDVGPGIDGVEGSPFLVFHGEVSADSDGPLEVCRPVVDETGDDTVENAPEVELRVEPAHDEAYVRLSPGDLSPTTVVKVCDALRDWVVGHGRTPIGPVRQLLVVEPGAPTGSLACDLTIPLG